MMISVEEQQNLLLRVARHLEKPLTVYAVGGTAMMFLGLKDATLDLDLVFETESERKIFSHSLERLGYKKMDSVIVYGERKNRPEMYTRGEERFDLFVVHVVHFDFSKQMRDRAKDTHQFDKNLFLKIANPHDLILMKCATNRKKDLDDARQIIERVKIDWNIIVEEAKNQIKLGIHTAAFELGEFLEKLKYELKLEIPIKVLDILFKLVQNQAKEKLKKER